MDAMTKHQIKRESYIYNNNNLKKTYNNLKKTFNNNSIKTIQCTYSSPPMSSEHTNGSLTIRITLPTVTRDQEDTSKNFSSSHTLMTSTCKLHGYTYRSSTRWWCLKFDLPNGQTLEAASATGKYCKNYDAEVKALEQGAQAVIDLPDTNSEDSGQY